VLGYLDPNYFLGGRKLLVRERAVTAINEHIASRMGLSVEEAAWQIVQTSEDDVARQIKAVVDGRRLKPDSLTLFAFGGGGGVRCSGYASRLGVSRVMVFAFNAVASAFGASTMDILHTYESSVHISLRSSSGTYPTAEWQLFNEAVAQMIRSAQRDMRGEGFSVESLSFTLELGVHGAGGVHWMDSPLILLEEEGQARKLVEAYFSCSGVNSGKVTIERVSLQARCATPHHQLPEFPEQGASPVGAMKGARRVYWGDGYVETNVYERDLLRCGNMIDGPAIVEASDTTYAVPGGWSYTVDKYLNGTMERSRNEG